MKRVLSPGWIGAIFVLGMDVVAPIEGDGVSKNARKRAAKAATAQKAVVLIETRQLRRARERAEKKGRPA